MTAGQIAHPLGSFLQARRKRLDPVAYGYATARRRTPGLRREEVAQRADISAKWYTFLEQGRGGAPSNDVLDRLATALDLTGAERDHLFQLAQPDRAAGGDACADDLPSALRRLLETMEYVPALVKTPTWDIVAWNAAATAALTDYGALPPERRNLLRLLFAGPQVEATILDWEGHARRAVAAFRLETVRTGLSAAAAAHVEDLSRTSRAFAAMWQDQEVGAFGDGVKRIDHPVAGPLAFEYATLAVDGRPELGLVVFTPASAADLDRVKSLVGR